MTAPEEWDEGLVPTRGRRARRAIEAATRLDAPRGPATLDRLERMLIDLSQVVRRQTVLIERLNTEVTQLKVELREGPAAAPVTRSAAATPRRKPR
ncbi:MAG: hypothetical protein QOJ92_2883 [Frankiales bacterium]|nr:hypothetical protein [Frankiales bacterium]